MMMMLMMMMMMMKFLLDYFSVCIPNHMYWLSVAAQLLACVLCTKAAVCIRCNLFSVSCHVVSRRFAELSFGNVMLCCNSTSVNRRWFTEASLSPLLLVQIPEWT